MNPRWRCATALLMVGGLAVPPGVGARETDALAAPIGAATADALAAPPGVGAGNAERGRAIAADRRVGLCTLCHRAPLADPHLQGDLGPPLHGIGLRLTQDQLRLRVADPKRLNPQSVMPAYAQTAALNRVTPRHAGQPLLDAQQIEDVVAWLATLR